MTKKSPSTGRFCDLGIDEKFISILSQKGFVRSTPIQHQVIPGALAGKDVVGIAQTGTGKTLAFGIPIIQQILNQKGQGLVLVPTRELALQVEKALRKICHPLGMHTVSVIGGVPQHIQVKMLKRKPEIIVSTPGRLVDLMNQGIVKLESMKRIVLDEADRMLDIGFMPQIKEILNTAPKKRQTMLFSATMPKTISGLSTAFMKLPIRIEIAPQGTSAKNVQQEVCVVSKQNKMRLLDALLQKYKEEKILVFSRTKFGAKKMTRNIRNMDHTVTEIHSSRSQTQRKNSLDGFKKGKYRVMVATDIAARGIDVKNIGLVINFDLPDQAEDYVHRIGRTGRAGRHGKAISFMTTSQKADVKKIERLMKKSLKVISLPELPKERENIHRDGKREKKYSSKKGNSKQGAYKKFSKGRKKKNRLR